MLDTPIGRLSLAASEAGLTRCTFGTVRRDATDGTAQAERWLGLARDQLTASFAGELRAFTVPADLRRVEGVHRRVLGALAEVGYGSTTTYGELAATLGLTDDGPRQVGGAMARNPVLVVVPCHRVLGAGGTLVGYAGGLAAKRWLLDLEAHDREGRLDLVW